MFQSFLPRLLALMGLVLLFTVGASGEGNAAGGIWYCKGPLNCPDGIGRAADDYWGQLPWETHRGIDSCILVSDNEEQCTGKIAGCFGLCGDITYVGTAYLDCPFGSIASNGLCVEVDDLASDQNCQPTAGNPVDVLTGRKHEQETDWSSGGTNPLEFVRTYSSQISSFGIYRRSRLGKSWRSNFDAAAAWNGSSPDSATVVRVVLPNSFMYAFARRAGQWAPVLPRFESRTVLWDTFRSDIDVTLTTTSSGLTLRVQNGDRYVFGSRGELIRIEQKGGYVQTLSYTNGVNTRVEDNLGHWINFYYVYEPLPYLLSYIETSDGTFMAYGYSNRYLTATSQAQDTGAMYDLWALDVVALPDATPATFADNPEKTYEYAPRSNDPFLLTAIVDERGVRNAEWTYDYASRATSSQHAGGADHWDFVYDDAANKVTTTNPLGRKTVYSFSRAQGSLRQLNAVDGVATSNCVASNTRYSYDANGFRSQAIDAEGRTTTWVRNNRGLPLIETDAAGSPDARRLVTDWDAVKPQPRRISLPGQDIRYDYDALDRVVAVTRTDTATKQSRITRYSYSGFRSAPVAIDGPLPGTADTWRYVYDSQGYLASATDPLGHVTRITAVNGAGQPLSLRDPNGVVSNMTYNPRGWLTSVTVNPGSAQSRLDIAYDAIGQVTRVTATDGSYLNYEWNDARRLTAVSNNAGERIEYGYNVNGDVTSRTVKSASGAIVRQQSALFDELGRLMRAIGAAGQKMMYSYDRTDNLTEVRDTRGGIFAYAYDGLQNLAKLTDQAGGRVKLQRDPQGNVTGYSDPRGITTRYTRNGFGEIIAESGPDLGATLIERDERGLPTRITDPRGVVTTLAYDAAGRLIREAHPTSAAEDVTYFYDDTTKGNKGVDRLTGILDQSGSTSFYYDALGRVTVKRQVIAGKSYVTSFGYDGVGRLAAINYPSGRVVSYSRNAVGRITGVTTSASASASAQTVASGLAWAPMSDRLAALTHGNGLATTLGYDGDGRLASLRLADGTKKLTDLGYVYGDGMNLTAVNDNVAAARSSRFAYDRAQRLAYAQGPWGVLTYGYTPTGDRAQETLVSPGAKTPLITSLQYPKDSNRLASTSVDSFTTRSFTYDAAGNMLREDLGTERLDFTYNLRNRPASLTRSGDGVQTSTYLYNALEQLVQRSTSAPGGPRGAVHYIYGLEGELLAEADGVTGATQRDYIWLPRGDAGFAADNDNEEGASSPPLPIGLVTGVNTATPKLLMVHADHLGRPVRLTDATRATVWSASYDPFGQPVNVGGVVEQNLRFPGQYFLIESGLAYNWHRFYDPATGRYTQPDPLRFVDGPSVYGYAGQSPMMRVDPDGLRPYPRNFIGPITPEDCFSPVPTHPPGVDVDSNMKEAWNMWPDPWAFRDAVRNKGRWDYKQQGPQYEDFGNFNYGATGHSFGFSDWFLFMKAGEAQIVARTSRPEWQPMGGWLPPYGDDPKDQEWIKNGIDYAKNGGQSGCSCK